MSALINHQKSISERILLIRGQKVMLDKDLASLYEIKPIALRQQVKRNLDRFPEDFFFQLNEQEVEMLVSQFVIASKRSLGGFLPYVFTEQGVAMLSSVLKSKRAIQVNIVIMRVFVQIRAAFLENKELAQKFNQLEQKAGKHDKEIQLIFNVIKQLMTKPEGTKKKIGFRN
jgi:hypothetical protein